MSQEIIIDEEIKASKIIEINDKTFALCFKYIVLQIYKINESQKYTQIMEKWILGCKSNGRLNLIKVNESKLASCSSSRLKIYFLDIKNNFKEIACISAIDCSKRKHSMLILNDIILMV